MSSFESRLSALRYVKNANSSASVEQLKDDYAPIGDLVWRDLEDNDLATTNADGNVVLTKKGLKQLEDAE